MNKKEKNFIKSLKKLQPDLAVDSYGAHNSKSEFVPSPVIEELGVPKDPSSVNDDVMQDFYPFHSWKKDK